MAGSVNGITNANLMIEGQRMRLPVILENEKYTATIQLNNPAETKITGPASPESVQRILFHPERSKSRAVQTVQILQRGTPSQG